ncbi:PTS glucose transporter subunit IIA [Rhodococcus sp. IEGM 1381]|uniref:PTS sugar transporter subunit IIA n=1 Tax=Rhodococcus sp. IEGM 1381 TaxID=3047085 RepID=UPI0024B70519|nr:PTS glucose transporter subunit IIA [Rhodococcus sp. IEGM 1381]MDI9897603.1 PTS glucose transporter subunit IIA [Rhodococcus sp. IEGM 1381]
MNNGNLILSPVAGRVISLAEAPDPVFSAQMVGSGVALRPAASDGPVEVRSPVAGKILKLHPHAFVVFTDDKAGVLVHIGIDTVKMRGEGFDLVAAEGDRVQAGDLVVTYDPAAIAAAGYSDVVPVVLMDSKPDSITSAYIGTEVATGDPLFELP